MQSLQATPPDAAAVGAAVGSAVGSGVLPLGAGAGAGSTGHTHPLSLCTHAVQPLFDSNRCGANATLDAQRTRVEFAGMATVLLTAPVAAEGVQGMHFEILGRDQCLVGIASPDADGTVCCGMLRYAAVCCGVLQYIAVSCSMLQYVAMSWQCLAVSCSASVLQYVAVCCSVLQHPSVLLRRCSHRTYVAITLYTSEPYIHTCTNIYVLIDMHTCTYIRVPIDIHTCTYIHVLLDIRVCTYVYMYICIRTCVWI